MDFFKRAKEFRLKCCSQSKYLESHKDEERVKLTRDSSSNNARWSYELVEGKPNVIRIRSCSTWRYLGATEDPCLFGMTGKVVVQTIIQGPTIEWEVIKEGAYIKLQSHTGSLLRANRGPPPWRNSVTHDEPGHWTGTENMTLWIVDIIVIDYQSSKIGNEPTPLKEEAKTIDVCSSTKHSESSVKPKPILVGSDDSNKVHVNKENGAESKYPAPPSLRSVQPLEVKKAKQNLQQLKSADFNTILSSGQGKVLEKAVDVIIADAKSSGRIASKLINIQEQLKSMKSDHESASHDLVGFSTFSTKRLEVKDELRKYVAKARELEKSELDLTNKVVHERAKREELLKQLEEVENSIRDVEKSQADNMVAVDELVSRIEAKSGKLIEMESQGKSWRLRKIEAERMQERIEKDWGMVKNMFEDYQAI